MKHQSYCIPLLLSLLSLAASAQNEADTAHSLNGSVVRAVNPLYDEAGKVKRFYFGTHYRREWATPVTIPVLDLDSAGGGLTPEKLGGGQQTVSLRLKGADGKEYVLRSVNKDPAKAIPRELQGTFAEDVVQDQISSSNPFAPMAVAELAKAAGILHSTPVLVYVPPSPRLGAFNGQFAHMICLLEERPSEWEKGRATFGAHDILNSEKLFEKLREDVDDRVDARAYLRARLFDIWIGDWDRHEDQWQWAEFKDGKKSVYQPIPRDRDQAFASLDGVVPWIAARKWAIRKTQHFDETIRDVAGLNLNGLELDRRLLTSLELPDWIAVAEELQRRLTDERIGAAIGKMPPEIAALSGPGLVRKLQRRRDDLKTYTIDYYMTLARVVDVVGSEKRELFRLTSAGADATRLQMYSIKKTSPEPVLVYERIFHNKETDEIRLYGLEGEDVFRLEGGKGPRIRIIPGDGPDSILAAPASVLRVKAYDRDREHYVEGPGVRTYRTGDSLKTAYRPGAWKHDWLAPKFAPGYNPDDGLYLGGGIIFRRQQFGKEPYGHQQSVWGNYALGTGAFNFRYEGIFREAIGQWDLHLDARINAPNYVLNYYGLGNETELLTKDRSFNRVRLNQWLFTPSLNRAFGEKHRLGFGLSYQTIRLERNEGRFVTDPRSKLDSTRFERKQFGSALLRYRFDGTNDLLYPTRGFVFNSSYEWTQNLQGPDRSFGRLAADAALYATAGPLTLALRAGGAANLGDDYEFYQANTLGSTTNLRGYRRTRFAGKSAMYGNTELRLKFREIRGYFLKGNWGLLAFLDGGRVWMPGEESNKLHTGYGGGIWFLPFNRVAFSATYGLSREDNVLSIKAGFLF